MFTRGWYLRGVCLNKNPISTNNTVSELAVVLLPLTLKDLRTFWSSRVQLSEIWELDKWLNLYGDFCESQLFDQIAIK